MYSNLLELVNTKHEAVVLSDEADLLLQSIYEKKGEGLEEALSKRVRVEVAERIRVALSGSLEVKDFLEGLKQALEALPEAILTIAFEPKQVVADRLAAEVAKSTEKKVLVKVNVDKELIGGAVIEFQGNRANHSVKKALLV